MNSLCLKFKTEMYNEFPRLDFGIIIYGSNISDTNQSDLDVCIICDNICNKDKEKITKKVIEFHHENNLKIDNEVPYESKLIVSYKDIKDAIIDNPFVNKGIVSINPIVKTEEFLASKEMKKRLILNILTTKHISINCKKIIKEYEEKAWDLILNTIVEYASLNDLSPENILKNLYCDANTGNEGEMFLGYKNNNIEKEKHLIKQIKKALNRYKKKRKTIILCNNLNPYLPNKKMRLKLASNVKLLKTYPTATSNKVNRVISDKLSVPIETTIVTNGSTEAFDYLLRIPDIKKVGIFTPTFWGYESACKRNNCEIIKIPLKDNRYYEYDKIDELSKNVDMIFICNPNNPTLDTLNREKLLNIIRKNQNCHFVIDETELVFNADYSERTLINETINNINLSVITSVSKFFGVPGLRCGFIITNEVNAKEINKIRILFSINIFSELFIINYFNRFNDIRLINKIQKNFTYLISNLNSKYIKEIINVNTGFILIRFEDSIDVNDLTEYLQTNGIIIRNIKKSYPNFLGECIRVSAGKRNEFSKLIKYINLYMKNKTK